VKTNVLIIGAGPTGLLAALQLKRQGVDCIIVDKKSGPVKESRALVMHARTMEIYDHIGIAGKAEAEGEVLKKAQFIASGKKVMELPFGDIGGESSPFPYVLILEQNRNEEILLENLAEAGGLVLWEHEMVSLKESEEGMQAEIKNKDSYINLEADWVIAADGSKSTARHLLNIPFQGGTYKNIFYVADVMLDWEWGHRSVSICTSGKSLMGLFPMKGDKHFRLVGILPVEYQNEHPENFSELVPVLEKQIGLKLKLSNISWFALYRIHHRYIKQFRKGRVFFAGDAAHIHSPAGGQGMNTGLQDAYNLAWKLGLVIKENVNEKILDTYEQERLPLAKRLVASTDRGFGFMAGTKWYNKLVRMFVIPYFLPFIFKFRKIRLLAFRSVSQTGLSYISSDLTMNNMHVPLTIKAGERFPYMHTKKGESIYHLMKEPVFHTLVFSKNGNLVEKLNESGVLRKFIMIHDLSKEKEISKKLKVRRDTVILVRPDHYIGLITDEGSNAVMNYMRSVLMNERRKNEKRRIG
jgi:2-polyprenyl-6-methoxyphenol hydroxylase-like FAD-dependent oxidoreductase